MEKVHVNNNVGQRKLSTSLELPFVYNVLDLVHVEIEQLLQHLLFVLLDGIHGFLLSKQF